MFPLVGFTSPFIIFKVVVFPQPDGPISATNSPLLIDNEISFKIFVFLYNLLIFSNFINIFPPYILNCRIINVLIILNYLCLYSELICILLLLNKVTLTHPLDKDLINKNTPLSSRILSGLTCLNHFHYK